MNESDIPLARRDRIAERLLGGKAVAAATLAAEFGVSEDAIRRDLRALAADGLCRRVYGGALPISPANTPMTQRIKEGQEKKTVLAEIAVSTIQPDEFIFLDNSSTHLVLASLLPKEYNLTVATSSILIGSALLTRKDLSLILIGGSVNNQIGGSVDASALYYS